jgi:hypothetical protein
MHTNRKKQKLNLVLKDYLLSKSTPASYSGGPGFKSRPLKAAILIEGFRSFPQSLQANTGIVP